MKRVLVVLSMVLFITATSEAAAWYVKAGAPHPGNGSTGGNRFVNNGLVPAGGEVNPFVFTADVSVHNPNMAPANGTIQVFASDNYWGGGPPVVTTGPFNAASGADIVTSGKVTVSWDGFLATDPSAP